LVKKYGSGKPVTMDLIEREAPLSFFAQDQMGFNAAMDVVFKVKQETAIVLTFKGM
jgi:hypothetical protein